MLKQLAEHHILSVANVNDFLLVVQFQYLEGGLSTPRAMERGTFPL